VKISTWNVNGLRACYNDLAEYLKTASSDLVALQEIKVNAPANDLILPDYKAIWNCAERPGYSGTLCLIRQKPLAVKYGLGKPKLDTEGRLITLEYSAFYFINCYTPNSQGSLDRWYHRLEWDTAFAEYIESLQSLKPVIIGGDFNVAHQHIDIYPENLKNDKEPRGFSTEERSGFQILLEHGLVDVFRELNPNLSAYSWWSNRFHKRNKNHGWRIDYFLVTDSLFRKVKSCRIRNDVFGSDHAPLELEISV